MTVSLIFKIAAVGVLVSVICQVLKHSGREEHAFLTSLAGLLIVLFWIVPYIYDLFEKVAKNGYDLLEKGRFACLIIGDKYANSQHIPLGFECMARMNKLGFITKAIIIKDMQGNERAKGKTANLWRYRAYFPSYRSQSSCRPCIGSSHFPAYHASFLENPRTLSIVLGMVYHGR